MPRYLDDGNWVPLHKAGVSKLPRNRPYSEVEAMFSLSCDLDNGQVKSIRSYARMWRWSPGRVQRFLKSALHLNFSEWNTRGHSNGPGKFMCVKGLRRPVEQKRTQQRTTTNDPDPDNKRPVRRKRQKKPWSGLGKDLDRLLACDAYIQHLTTDSPVLAQWSFAEIRAWARNMVDKANRKRATRHEALISMPIALIRTCTARLRPDERPQGVESAMPDEIIDAAEAMGVN